MTAPIHSWLVDPIDGDVKKAIRRLARADDVVHVAVMPDVHLAHDVPIGTVVATNNLVYPQAVGGDIGCGMTSLRFELHADAFESANDAASVLHQLGQRIPINKHPTTTAADRLPIELREWSLSAMVLDRLKNRDGRVQLGTLGRGNHFVEFQADESDCVWITIHSGSRGMGQAITNHHLEQATASRGGLRYLRTSAAEAQQPGDDYINDMRWAVEYATANRMQMLFAVCEIIGDIFAAEPDEGSLINCHHNHLVREVHDDRTLWVHRKGAAPAAAGETGVIPGSMGTATYHVVGRGCARSLCSSSHGAGRRLSRTEARRLVRTGSFHESMEHIWFDRRKSNSLREEAPEAYRDVRKVMRAQKELVKIQRRLRPLLNFKGS